MSTESEDLFESKPAPYPRTASAEMDSRNIFLSLIDTRFIKGEIRVLDKYPNSDGILEITDAGQFPIGKIDVQLKTLSPVKYSSPGYSIDRSFLAYCRISALPVILVVVNREQKVAYWRHIDEATIKEVEKNISADSYTLPIPTESCIDGQRREYIDAWSQRAKEVSQKVWNFNSEQQQKKELEIALKNLSARLQDPVNLPDPLLKLLYRFLDEYNFVLDKEFYSVKGILFPDYWKIGIGIIRMKDDQISFVLYPVAFGSHQLLIKQVKQEEYEDISEELSKGTILLYASTSINKLATDYEGYAYHLLEDHIERVAGKYHFPLDDLLVACEYLISFIDRHHGYLDLDSEAEAYLINDVKFKLYSVLPMLVATEHSYADWVREHTHTIDSYDHWKSSSGYKKKIQQSIEKVEQGFNPRVKVIIGSQLYNMELINYYIQLLESRGHTKIERRYKTRQRDEKLHGVDIWKTWNKEVLWYNVQLFYKDFHRLHDTYIEKHFPFIADDLQIVSSKKTTIVYIFYFDETRMTRPHMEAYHIRPNKPEKGRVLIFLAEDPNNPIDRKKFGLDRITDCSIDGKNYTIQLMHVQVLDFMFSLFPTYALINEIIAEKLKSFFRKRSR